MRTEGGAASRVFQAFRDARSLRSSMAASDAGRAAARPDGAAVESVERPAACSSVRCDAPPVKRDVPTLTGQRAFGTRRDGTVDDSGEHGCGFGGNRRGADRPEQTVGGSQSARRRVARFSFAGSARPRRIPSAAQSPVGEPFIEFWGTAMLPPTKAGSRAGRLLTGHAVFRGDGAMAAPCPAAGKMPHRDRFVCRRADDPVSRIAVPFADRDRRRLDTRRGAQEPARAGRHILRFAARIGRTAQVEGASTVVVPSRNTGFGRANPDEATPVAALRNGELGGMAPRGAMARPRRFACQMRPPCVCER